MAIAICQCLIGRPALFPSDLGHISECTGHVCRRYALEQQVVYSPRKGAQRSRLLGTRLRNGSQ